MINSAHIFAALILAVTAPLLHAQSPTTPPTTYCNPLSLPDYPIGRDARNAVPGAPIKNIGLWLSDNQEQFRELADISVLFFDNKWFMYPSVDMAWVSADGGASWQHHPLNIRDIGYAPTIVRHHNKFLLMASESAIYTSDSPLGPFTPIGKITLPPNLPRQTDPMLFSDDDGRLYYYWGCSPREGIYAVELDAENPTHLLGQTARVIPYTPDEKPWQRLGDWNENPNEGWIEGSWMFKHGDTYYLTYSAAGTEYRTYAMGCSTSKSPLGPFTPQKHDPILRSTDGLITGTAHGSIVQGPNNSLWAFYTLRAAVVHGFERRLGMDPVTLSPDGEIYVDHVSSNPMRLPTATTGAAPTGWLPINTNVRTVGSSNAPNLTGRLAVDEDLRTWWQPAPDDKSPTLTSTFHAGPSTLHAFRIIWHDVGLDTKHGTNPGPYRYKIEAQTAPDTWTTLIDRSDSTEDLLIDYRECPPTTATAIRLVILGAPPGITPGVAEFTAFGEVVRK